MLSHIFRLVSCLQTASLFCNGNIILWCRRNGSSHHKRWISEWNWLLVRWKWPRKRLLYFIKIAPAAGCTHSPRFNRAFIMLVNAVVPRNLSGIEQLCISLRSMQFCAVIRDEQQRTDRHITTSLQQNSSSNTIDFMSRTPETSLGHTAIIW